MKKKFLLNTITSITMQIVTVICGFILPRLILGRYGSEINGLTHSISQFLGVITFLELGVGQVIQSSLYKPLAQKDSVGISNILASGSKFFRRIAYILLVYVAVLIAVYPLIIDRSFGWWYTAILIAVISIGNFARYYFGVVDSLLLNADQRGYVQYSSQIISTLLNTLACVWMVRLGTSIHILKLTTSLIFLIRPFAVRLYIKKRYDIDRKIKYTGEPIKQKWNGIAQHVSAVVLDGTDTIVLSVCSTLSNVSVYSVYYMVIAGIMQLYQSATAGLHSMAGDLWAKRETDKLNRLFGCIETALHFVTVFLFCCVGILIVPFVKVYTNGLTDADYIQPIFALILTVAYGVRCLRTPYNILILAGGNYKQTQRCHIIAAVLNIVISVVTVYLWGLVGVAIGTLIALTYQTTWMAVYDSKNLLKWPLRNVVKQVLADVLTAVLIYIATRWITLGEVTYFAWFVMAIKVAVIAISITVAVAMVFYRDRINMVYVWLRKRTRK